MVKYILIFLISWLIIACNESQKTCNVQLLNTSLLKEATLSDLYNHEIKLNVVRIIDIDLACQNQAKADTIPWADVYYCVTERSDTIVILDTRLTVPIIQIPPHQADGEVKSAKKHDICKINVPDKKMSMFKRLKYKYCSIDLIIDQ